VGNSFSDSIAKLLTTSMEHRSGYSRIHFNKATNYGETIELKHSVTDETVRTSVCSLPADDDTSLTRGESLNAHWKPLFLRSPVLVGFCLFSIAILVSLQVILTVSTKNNGIATSSDDKHFLWTYAPTALFTIVIVIWRQVDYNSKALQPWANMAAGPQPVENSLLLDYITLFQLISLFKSLSRRHWNASLSITVFILIMVIIAVSTGLFTLQTVTRGGVPTLMAVNNTFGGTD
jgi:hypothetical protein